MVFRLCQLICWIERGSMTTMLSYIILGLIKTLEGSYLNESMPTFQRPKRRGPQDFRFSHGPWTHRYDALSCVTHLGETEGKNKTKKQRGRHSEAPPTETETGISWRNRPDLTVTGLFLGRSVIGFLQHKHSHTCLTWDSFWPRCWLCSAIEVSHS